MKKLAVFAVLVSFAASPALADQAKGVFTVDGKPVTITQVYAYAKKGFFDAAKDDVVVLLCDAPVPPAAVRDDFARGDLVKAGKLHCVRQTIDADKHVINYKVEHSRFGMPESGGSTNQVFEATAFDGKTAAGRSFTKATEKSFDDVPYTYDITFSAAIGPK
jgi:hypothetical protein